MGLLIGFMRVSKADGSQVLDLQKDALLAAGVEERSLYQDQASGTREDRPGTGQLPQSVACWRYADRVEARPTGTRFTPSGQYRP